MPLLLALLASTAAFLSYRLLEAWTPRSLLPALARAAAWGALALLIFNASCPVAAVPGRPLVLLDASLSMQAAGGKWTEALALARRSGEVRYVGIPAGDTMPAAGVSRMAAAIAGAGASGRPVVVVTDGEVADAGEIPEALQERVTVTVLERDAVPDAALTRVTGTTRLTATDSLRLEVEVSSWGGAGEGSGLRIEVSEGKRLWLAGRMAVDSGGRGVLALAGPLPDIRPGPHVLTVAIAGAGDAEPRNDARLLVVTVVPTPGIVLLASPPTWESRFLLEALRDVAALPARGYLEIERGRWRRAGDLAPVTSAEVSAAARGADLLVTVGAVGEPARAARARGRLVWPPIPPRPGALGDWYLSVPAATPIGEATVGLPVDSFPPGTAIADLSPGPRDWVGLTAQAGRRGAVRPVLLGRDSAGVRSIVVGVDGLWRWSFRGGSSEQGYRGMTAAAVTWLLGGADAAAGRARLVREVVQQGRPAIFQWNGSSPAEPSAISFAGPAGTREDTLLFDGAGRAGVLLPPGTWQYRVAGGGQGVVAVEEYSEEWNPAPRTMSSRAAVASAGPGRLPFRSLVWLFGVAAAAFSAEWYARRRLGLR